MHCDKIVPASSLLNCKTKLQQRIKSELLFCFLSYKHCEWKIRKYLNKANGVKQSILLQVLVKDTLQTEAKQH